MAFRVGQKVVCVNAGNSIWGFGRWLPGEEVVEGKIYTIAAIGISFGEACFQLEEVSRITDDEFATDGVWGYNARRFRPIVEKKTDIGFAHEILRKVTRKQTVRA